MNETAQVTHFLRFMSRRRVLLLAVAAALLFGLLLLHPYPRQLLFGPKINGVPWCVWEDRIRAAGLANRKSWLARLLEQSSLMPSAPVDGVIEDAKLLPIYLHLTDDSDARVRQFCLERLERRVLKEEFWRWSPEDEAQILPIMRQHLADEDPICQLMAADYLWRATGDREMIKIPLAHLGNADGAIRKNALITLSYLAAADPEAAFDPLARAVFDTGMRLDVRESAVLSMRNLGERGASVLRKAFKDPSSDIRRLAVFAVSLQGKDGAGMIPDLLALRNDPDMNIRRGVARALSKIDASRFPAPLE